MMFGYGESGADLTCDYSVLYPYPYEYSVVWLCGSVAHSLVRRGASRPSDNDFDHHVCVLCIRVFGKSTL